MTLTPLQILVKEVMEQTREFVPGIIFAYSSGCRGSKPHEPEWLMPPMPECCYHTYVGGICSSRRHKVIQIQPPSACEGCYDVYVIDLFPEKRAPKTG